MAAGDRRGTVAKRRTGKQKVKVSITVSPQTLRWVEDRVGAGLPFGSLSHAFESGIVALQTDEPKKGRLT